MYEAGPMGKGGASLGQSVWKKMKGLMLRALPDPARYPTMLIVTYLIDLSPSLSLICPGCYLRPRANFGI
eukprot:scaffold233971_cov46-Prasinocladus_malaysianus.AAC.6